MTRTRRHWRSAALLLTAMVPIIGGCHTPQPTQPGPVMSLDRATYVVNRNIARVSGALRATGTVDGQLVTPEGKRRSFSVDATLFYLRGEAGRGAGPCVRFDLKKLGDRQVLIGSNAERYWCYSKETGEYECGWHNGQDELSLSFPIKPGQVVDALGLTPIPYKANKQGYAGTTQRVEGDSQQVLFLVDDERHGVKLEKEYWLDRSWPRLIRKVIFRNDNGETEMESALSGYRQIEPGGPWLPSVMEARWADPEATMRFTIRQWKVFPQVKADGVQFRTPRECEGR